MRSKAALACVAGAVLTAALVAHVSARPGQQPIFSARTSLLTIDVTVLDRAGRPVDGLTADDFEVKLNGKVEPVRAVAFLQAQQDADDAAAAAEPLGAPARAANTAPPPPEPRVFVLLIDDLSIATGAAKGLFTAGQRFITSLPSTDLIGVTTTSGALTLNPTFDRVAVQRALDKAVGAFYDARDALAIPMPTPGGGEEQVPFIGVHESLEIDAGMKGVLAEVIARDCPQDQGITAMSVERAITNDPCAEAVERNSRVIAAYARRNTAAQLQGIVRIVRAMGAARGIKHLVYFTDGIGLSTNFADLLPVARAAVEAGVQISTLAEEPNAVDASKPDSASSRIADARELQYAAETMTDMSGGQFYHVAGQADRVFARIAVSASAVYRLGVELPVDASTGRDISISASVKRAGLTVTSGHHALVPDLPRLPPADERVADAVTSGVRFFGVPLDLASVIRRGPSGDVEFDVNVEVPASVEGPLTTAYAIVNEKGNLTRGERPIVARRSSDRGYWISFPIRVKPGSYRLRFAAADATGALGSVESRVSARLNAMGPIQTSDLLVWWQDASGKRQLWALPTLPAGVPAVHATLELYPPAGMHALTVRLSVRPDGGSGQAPPLFDRVITPTGNGDVVRADAELPIGTLPSGSYVLSARVANGDTVLGTATTTIVRK